MRHRAMLYCTKLDQSVLHFPDVFTDSDVPQGNSSHEFLCFYHSFFLSSTSSPFVLLPLVVIRLESFNFFLNWYKMCQKNN